MFIFIEKIKIKGKNDRFESLTYNNINSKIVL